MDRHVSRRAAIAATVLLSVVAVLGVLRAQAPEAQDLSIQIAEGEEWNIIVTCNCSFNLTATDSSGAKKSQQASYQIYQEYDKKFLKIDKNLPLQVQHTYRSDTVTNLGAGGAVTPSSLQGAAVVITEAVAGEQPEVEIQKGTPAPAAIARLRAGEDCFLLNPSQPVSPGMRWKLDTARALSLTLQGDAVAGTAPEGAEALYESLDGDVAVIRITLAGKPAKAEQSASAEFSGEYRFNVKTRKPVSLRLKGKYKAVSRVGETPVTVDGTGAAAYDLTVKYQPK